MSDAPDLPGTIRAMTLADFDAVLRLYDGLDALHSEKLPGLFRRPDPPPRDLTYFRNLLEDPQATVLVADVGKVVGFVHVVLRDAPAFEVFVPQLHGLVDGIYVDPGWRRRGIGMRLMQSAEEWALARGVRGMDLNVFEFNAEARALFSALGYSTLSRKMSRP